MPPPQLDVPVHDILEIMGEMILSMGCVAYRLDTRLGRKGAVSDGDDGLLDESKRLSTDQWLHPLCCATLRGWGMDCEDASAAMLTFADVMKKSTLTASEVHPLLYRVLQYAKAYEFMIALGIINTTGRARVYHCFVVGEPAVEFYIRLHTKGARAHVTKRLIDDATLYRTRVLGDFMLPKLVFEGTETTTCNPNFRKAADISMFVNMYGGMCIDGRMCMYYMHSIGVLIQAKLECT